MYSVKTVLTSGQLKQFTPENDVASGFDSELFVSSSSVTLSSSGSDSSVSSRQGELTGIEDPKPQVEAENTPCMSLHSQEGDNFAQRTKLAKFRTKTSSNSEVEANTADNRIHRLKSLRKEKNIIQDSKNMLSNLT